eukprot:m.61298 g.61298  ORF g.61298 m.61298 type:complete len:667 (-) comp17542_c0_seq2:1448-3448(-)
MSMSMSMCGVLVVLVGSSAVAPFATGVNSPPQSVALGASDNPHRGPDLRTKLFGSDIPLQIPEDTTKLVGLDRGRRQSGPAPNMTIGGSIMCGNTANGSTIGAQNTIGHATGEHWYSFTAPVTGNYVFNTCGSAFDTWVHVTRRSGSSRGALVYSCDDCGHLRCRQLIGPAGLFRTIAAMTLTAGDYFVVIDAYDWNNATLNSGNYTFSARCPCGNVRNVPYSYTSWSSWSPAACGPAVRTRSESCTASCGGQCTARQNTSETRTTCCAQNATYAYGQWGQWNTSCGPGFRTRSESCGASCGGVCLNRQQTVDTIRTPCPTQAPSSRPTRAPTFHPCNMGSHDCNLVSTYCTEVPTANKTWTCACRSGFHRLPLCSACTDRACVMTLAPTATPTTAPTIGPTAAPSVVPTATPTALPTTMPTASPSETPTALPTSTPTDFPTTTPTPAPLARAQTADVLTTAGGGFMWLGILLALATVLCVTFVAMAGVRRRKSKKKTDEENTKRAVFANPLYDHTNAPGIAAAVDDRSALENPTYVEISAPPRNATRDARSAFVNPQYDEVSAPTITSADGETYYCVHPPGGVDAGIDGYMESPTGFDTPDTDEGYLDVNPVQSFTDTVGDEFVMTSDGTSEVKKKKRKKRKKKKMDDLVYDFEISVELPDDKDC